MVPSEGTETRRRKHQRQEAKSDTFDAALAGQGVALACRAFVAPDLRSGRLVQVSERVLTTGSDYFLVTPGRAKPREGVRQIMQWLEEEAMRDISDAQTD
ncbi:MAG: hypothetical protein J0I07_14885 [Myxococcales bacterium]|nr:hypothetical protein [Myxococcales bacterium]